ncbi:hypothetical protein ONE63_005002 [Megalurothrips usitatus]|uniref:Uncharacterized protein n=1 Tax=Megalurothrips usitatus TaxID=439358 RepID=A0AAV7X2A4_9NEOP|nr:hypothetical protein ONE63_005002 [Megalurothrips usitatus]
MEFPGPEEDSLLEGQSVSEQALFEEQTQALFEEQTFPQHFYTPVAEQAEASEGASRSPPTPTTEDEWRRSLVDDVATEVVQRLQPQMQELKDFVQRLERAAEVRGEAVEVGAQLQGLSSMMERVNETLSKQAQAVAGMAGKVRTVGASEKTAQEELARVLSVQLPADSTVDVARLEMAFEAEDNRKQAGFAVGSYGSPTLTLLCEKVCDLLLSPVQQRRMNATGSAFTEKERELSIPEVDPDTDLPASHKEKLGDYPNLMLVFVEALANNRVLREKNFTVRELEHARNVVFNRAAQRHDEKTRAEEGRPKRDRTSSASSARRVGGKDFAPEV